MGGGHLIGTSAESQQAFSAAIASSSVSVVPHCGSAQRVGQGGATVELQLRERGILNDAATMRPTRLSRQNKARPPETTGSSLRRAPALNGTPNAVLVRSNRRPAKKKPGRAALQSPAFQSRKVQSRIRFPLAGVGKRRASTSRWRTNRSVPVIEDEVITLGQLVVKIVHSTPETENMMAEIRLLVACQAVVSKPFISGTCHEIEVLRCMRLVSSIFLLLCCCAPALAFGFSFGGTGREYPYPNEPQYQYPGKNDFRRCPTGFAPYKGRCRKIRWIQ